MPCCSAQRKAIGNRLRKNDRRPRFRGAARWVTWKYGKAATNQAPAARQEPSRPSSCNTMQQQKCVLVRDSAKRLNPQHTHNRQCLHIQNVCCERRRNHQMSFVVTTSYYSIRHPLMASSSAMPAMLAARLARQVCTPPALQRVSQ